MSKHQKHTKLKLRENDNFAPNEIAIVGTKCSVIADLVQQVSAKLTQYKLAYLDASHSEVIEHKTIDSFTFHSQGTANISAEIGVNKFNQRIQFSQYDFLFINGNHYEGAKQILILDNEKETSVLKRFDQVNN
ncbi:MAG: molybdenum cofactor guanylyltransferase, partial [Lutibacter sp.]|nr:molybdenum cofactor guanylyltransferase [Lutibacter sp.]